LLAIRQGHRRLRPAAKSAAHAAKQEPAGDRTWAKFLTCITQAYRQDTAAAFVAALGESLESGPRSFADQSELSYQRWRKEKELRPSYVPFFFSALQRG
jgi:hypothetical protein